MWVSCCGNLLFAHEVYRRESRDVWNNHLIYVCVAKDEEVRKDEVFFGVTNRVSG